MTGSWARRASHHSYIAIPLLLGVGCAQDRVQLTSPPGHTPVVASADAPETVGDDYYLYEGGRVYLDVDSTRLVIAAGPATSEAAVRGALAESSPASIERTPQLPDHWTVRLGAGRSDAAAVAARLGADARFPFVSFAYRYRKDGSSVLLVNHVMVQFKPGVNQASIDSIVSSLGLSIVRRPAPRLGFLWYLLGYPPHAAPLPIVAALSRSPLIEFAEPDKIADRRVAETRSDPFYGLQYYLKNSTTFNGVAVDDNIEPAWALTKGAGVKVAVFDHGLDITNQDLCGVKGAGYDTFNYPGEDAWHPYPNNAGQDSHGTAVAGIIVGCHDNAIGIAGVAPEVTLIAVRIFRNGYINTDDQVAAAYNWAWSTAHADVLSSSWGGGAESQALTNAINAAATQGRNGLGAAVVFAAGNTSHRAYSSYGTVLYPGWLTAVIAVGAISRDGVPADYTPRDPALDMVAPSSYMTDVCTAQVGDVVTLDLWGAPGCNNGPGGDINYTNYFGGTSAAQPQVAGAAALLLAVHPTFSWGVAKPRIMYKSDPWGPSNDFGAGKLNIYHILVPPLYNFIVATPPYYESNPSGGDMPYTYLWEWKAGDCPPDAVAPLNGGGGVVPNRPACGWQQFSTSQQVYWVTHNRLLRSTVTDVHDQQAQLTYFVP